MNASFSFRHCGVGVEQCLELFSGELPGESGGEGVQEPLVVLEVVGVVADAVSGIEDFLGVGNIVEGGHVRGGGVA